MLTCGGAQGAPDEVSRRVEEGPQIKGWHVKRFHSVISDFGVSVETGPRVDVEFPVGGVEHVSDVMSLQSPFVFGSVPGLKTKPVRIHIFPSAHCL